MSTPGKTPITSWAELRRQAAALCLKRVGVVLADDAVALTAAGEALRARITKPLLLGDERAIRAHALALGYPELLDEADFIPAGPDPLEAAQLAVRMVHEGSIDILMKGHLRTDQLLRPVLDKQNGLRSGQILCDVAFFEHTGEDGRPRMIGLSDSGIIPAPTFEQKRQIVHSCLPLLELLGIERPKIALMSAVEVPTEVIPSTMEARQLTELARNCEFGQAEVFGPLALDNALYASAALAKGITSPVAGHADCLLMPNIEAGNLLAKSIIFLLGRPYGHIVVGARAPILIPSRVEPPLDKLNAMALGVLYACR